MMRRKSRLPKIIGWVFVLLALFIFSLRPMSSFCLPQPADVGHGTAEITYPDASTMQINASDKAILNYRSFNINSGESVIVNLPTANSSILNRVLGDEASSILGSLSCNGAFFLVN